MRFLNLAKSALKHELTGYILTACVSSVQLISKKPMNKPRVWIVSPVYNDWESAAELVGSASKMMIASHKLSIVFVDDASSHRTALREFINHVKKASPHFPEVFILQLSSNSGNQRALIEGLTYLNSKKIGERDLIVTMDSDGEDKVEDIPKLIAARSKNESSVVVAKRGKRHQSPGFLIWHIAFKFIFKLLAKEDLDFGNFMCFDKTTLTKFSSSSIQGHISLPGILLSSKIDFGRIKLDRGRRLHGKSKTNKEGLILWGISTLSPVSKIVSARILKFSVITAICLFLLAFTILALRLTTDLFAVGSAGILISIGAFFSILFIQTSAFFILLTTRIESLVHAQRSENYKYCSLLFTNTK